MKRRDWLAAATATLASAAQGQPRPRRVSIGWVASVPIRRWPPYPAFVEAMREPGWIEGTHYPVDEASYDGQATRIPQVVAELVARKPDLIFGSATPPMRPLIAAT